jgi:hypothetical protein
VLILNPILSRRHRWTLVRIASLVFSIIPALISAAPQAGNNTRQAQHAKSGYSLENLAGHYSFGNGLDQNFELIITADGQFTYQQASYEGVMAEAEGQADMRGNRLVLRPSTGTPEAWPASMGLELVPVRWAHRLYLVPEKDLMLFVQAVNRGNEPVRQVSRGSFFLREGDWDKPAPGAPQLPVKYAALLLAKPMAPRPMLAPQAAMWQANACCCCSCCNTHYGSWQQSPRAGCWTPRQCPCPRQYPASTSGSRQ